MAPKWSPRVGNGSAEGDWGVVGKGTYMGGCMGASSMGAGHQGGARLLEGLLEGDDHGSTSRSTSGSPATATTRRLGNTSSARKRARRVLNKQNDVHVSRTLEHLSTLC